MSRLAEIPYRCWLLAVFLVLFPLSCIDAASTVFVSIYEADRQNPGQGLHTWLKAKVREALKHIKDEDDNVKEIRANVYSVKMMAGFWLVDLSGYTPALVEVSQSSH